MDRAKDATTDSGSNVVERWQTMAGARSAPVKNTVERGAVRKYAEAIEDPNPLYINEEVAKESRYGGSIVPPTFLRTLEYGQIEGLGLPDSGLIHGEHRIRYEERPLLVGEEVHCYMELKSYQEKESQGGILGFLLFERIGQDQDGNRIFTLEDTVIVMPVIREQLSA